MQYKGFEPGEFTEITNRSLEETITLIKSYPWEQERHLTPVDLTGPSISIEDNEGNILKLGTGYYSHFKLYWLKASDKIYLHDVNNLDEAIQIITEYCKGKDISDGFKPYKSLSSKKHFVTNDFIYTVTLKRILLNILGANIYGDGLIIAIWLMTLCVHQTNPTPLFMKVFLCVLWMYSSGINYIYLFRYWYLAQNQSIQISKGINQFTFSDKKNSKPYNKKDIARVIRHYSNTRSYKGDFFSNKVVYTIEMKNDEKITFNSLLIPDFTFWNKIPSIKVEQVDSHLPLWY